MVLLEVYRRFERILDMSRFTERERQDFGRISWDMDAATAAQSVRLLTDCSMCIMAEADYFTG